MPENLDELRIVTYPHPAIRQVAEPVADPTDPAIARLAEKMCQLMHQADGVGLAATQVAVSLRLFVADPDRQPGQELVFINPEVVQTEGWQDSQEGCLSIPDVSLKLHRRQRVVLRYVDTAGQARQIEAVGHLARIIQHETDHLDGRLITDRAGLVGRMAVRDTLKRLEDEFRSASVNPTAI